MSDDAPDSVSDDVRYAPRAVDDEEWMSEFLRRRPAGVLGLVDDGAPYVVTQLFAYDDDEHAVFFHGANEGKTKRIVERSDRATFTVNAMGRLLPAEKPVNFDVEYESAVAFGRVRLLEDAESKRRALERFMEKFAPHLEAGQDYEPMSPASVDRTSVYRLDIERWSGKRHVVDDDFPGAFAFDAVRGDGDSVQNDGDSVRNDGE